MAFLNGNQIFLFILKFFKWIRLNKYQHTHGMLKLTAVTPLNKRIWLITSKLLSRDTRVLYRPKAKPGPDALIQVLWIVLTSNFVRYIGMAKENYKWRSKWLPHNLGTIYRPDTKWGPDLVSQVLQELLSSTFMRYIRLAKEFN